MNNKERFVLHLGTIIQSGCITPVDRYYNHDDWYLGKEIWEQMPSGFCVAPYELKELSDKPAIVQRMEFINMPHENHTVYRITKAGWKLFDELKSELPQEEQEHVKEQEQPEPEAVYEKSKKILWYVPWSKADKIKACWEDADGYWIELNDGWIASRMDQSVVSCIHEKTIYDLRYQIGGIRKVS